MKTRKSIAMALTIVLSLAAGTLLVWQFPPRLANDNPASFKPAEPPVASAIAPEKTDEPVDTAAETVAGTAQSIPTVSAEYVRTVFRSSVTPRVIFRAIVATAPRTNITAPKHLNHWPTATLKRPVFLLTG